MKPGSTKEAPQNRMSLYELLATLTESQQLVNGMVSYLFNYLNLIIEEIDTFHGASFIRGYFVHLWMDEREEGGKKISIPVQDKIPISINMDELSSLNYNGKDLFEDEERRRLLNLAIGGEDDLQCRLDIVNDICRSAVTRIFILMMNKGVSQVEKSINHYFNMPKEERKKPPQTSIFDEI